jgi:hypothetical protein
MGYLVESGIAYNPKCPAVEAALSFEASNVMVNFD